MDAKGRAVSDRFVVGEMRSEVDMCSVLPEAEVERWPVIDTEALLKDGLEDIRDCYIREEIAVCPTEDAANLVCYGLNLLIRAQAGVEKEAKGWQRNMMNGGGNLILPQ